jgi:hypothetical protein
MGKDDPPFSTRMHQCLPHLYTRSSIHLKIKYLHENMIGEHVDSHSAYDVVSTQLLSRVLLLDDATVRKKHTSFSRFLSQETCMIIFRQRAYNGNL